MIRDAVVCCSLTFWGDRFRPQAIGVLHHLVYLSSFLFLFRWQITRLKIYSNPFAKGFRDSIRFSGNTERCVLISAEFLPPLWQVVSSDYYIVTANCSLLTRRNMIEVNSQMNQSHWKGNTDNFLAPTILSAGKRHESNLFVNWLI